MKTASHTITAHYSTLRRALKEARKYGVTHRYEAVRMATVEKGSFVHDIAHDRQLVIGRAPGGPKRWKMTVDVVGRVTPIVNMPKILTGLLILPRPRKETPLFAGGVYVDLF